MNLNPAPGANPEKSNHNPPEIKEPSPWPDDAALNPPPPASEADSNLGKCVTSPIWNSMDEYLCPATTDGKLIHRFRRTATDNTIGVEYALLDTNGNMVAMFSKTEEIRSLAPMAAAGGAGDPPNHFGSANSVAGTHYSIKNLKALDDIHAVFSTIPTNEMPNELRAFYRDNIMPIADVMPQPA